MTEKRGRVKAGRKRKKETGREGKCDMNGRKEEGRLEIRRKGRMKGALTCKGE